MMRQTLFGNEMINVPKTQGIKYAGSKLKLLPRIFDTIRQLDAKLVLDGFSGTSV